MRVFSLTLQNDLLFIEKINLNIKKFSNVNTNIIVDNRLYYTKLFIKFNKDEISKLLFTNEISKIIYKDFVSYFLFSSIFKCSSIKFDINKALSIKVMDSLLKDDLIKSIECYFMPGDYVHLFALKGLSIKFINDMIFTPSFVSSNEFKNLESIYYRKSVSFFTEKELYDNLESFFKVNSLVQLIHLYFCSKESIDFLVSVINRFNLKEIDIFIHQNYFNLEDIINCSRYLKRVNKKYSNSNREIKIIYSDKFFKENIFRELTVNGVKLCMIAVLYIGVVFMISTKYHEYVALLNLRLLEESLADTNINVDNSIDDMNDEEVNPPVEEEEIPENNEEPPKKEYINFYANIPTTFDKLLSINSDVVGWLSVNNTKVNYPITKSNDNQYYLEHDIYNKKIITGWVFMDYRNNAKDLDQNTIIYGHNLISGYMFGSLSNALDKEWYTNEENHTIIFNTLDNEMKWKIFSVYRTDYTTDYLKTGFFNDEQFNSFISMVKDRSIYKFNTSVNPGSKILTLSTCTGSNNRRLVIHAVLI